mmetsp:Transcript_4444/g.15820  ORF Transcript_4444/g.15820 Transcript_4444/m.15820 type:complete len:83 (-) Transcript_4444:1402-1650(-)
MVRVMVSHYCLGRVYLQRVGQGVGGGGTRVLERSSWRSRWRSVLAPCLWGRTTCEWVIRTSTVPSTFDLDADQGTGQLGPQT